MFFGGWGGGNIADPAFRDALRHKKIIIEEKRVCIGRLPRIISVWASSCLMYYAV